MSLGQRKVFKIGNSAESENEIDFAASLSKSTRKILPLLVIELLTSLLVPDFPSGSSITLYNDQIYVIGDDAPSILVLNMQYEKIATIPLFNFSGERIPKAEKPDVESSLIVQSKGKDCLLLLGSASRPNREKAFLVHLTEGDQHILHIDLSDFAAQLRNLAIGEINLEGSTSLNEFILISNRANHSNPVNTILLTANDFWSTQQATVISTITLVLPEHAKLAGVSELCYIPLKDLLLITLTNELTSNAYDDGVIGDSYLGWIDHASEKLKSPSLTLDGLINLTDAHVAFKGEKIEGVLFERIDQNDLIIHLVSDNDLGESKLFKIKLTLY